MIQNSVRGEESADNRTLTSFILSSIFLLMRPQRGQLLFSCIHLWNLIPHEGTHGEQEGDGGGRGREGCAIKKRRDQEGSQITNASFKVGTKQGFCHVSRILPDAELSTGEICECFLHLSPDFLTHPDRLLHANSRP